MNTYIAFYNNKELEITAESLYKAKLEAIKQLKVCSSQEHKISVVLVKVGDREIVHSTAEFG